MDSILTSIKKLLGIEKEYTNFDDDLIIHINSAFSMLTQLGIGPEEGFRIIDEETTWNDYIPENPRLSMIKDYMYYKVRLMFDPPQSSAVIEVMNRMTSELEWRLNLEADSSRIQSKEENQNG